MDPVEQVRWLADEEGLRGSFRNYCFDRLVDCGIARRDLGTTWPDINYVYLPVDLVAEKSDLVKRVEIAPLVLTGISDEHIRRSRTVGF